MKKTRRRGGGKGDFSLSMDDDGRRGDRLGRAGVNWTGPAEWLFVRFYCSCLLVAIAGFVVVVLLCTGAAAGNLYTPPFVAFSRFCYTAVRYLG